MIILDEDQEQFPKIASPLPVHPVVRRPATPTPSLPDYETSQEQEQQKESIKPKPRSRRWRWTIYGLIAYFVVTIAIGVPLIVIKTRHDSQSYKNPSMLYPSQPPWSNSSTSGLNLGETSVCVDSATACNTWDFKDQWQDGLMRASLEYNLPVTSTIFVQSNLSCAPFDVGDITGSLNVGINTDPTQTQATVGVFMSYTGTDVREQTSVCLMNLSGSDGLYIYVPPSLTYPDHLDFNITFLFPKPKGSTQPIYIENFYTSLCYFDQQIGALSPRITFGNVGLVGMRSNITIANMQAEALLVKSPYSDISGMFNVTGDSDDGATEQSQPMEGTDD